jgi:glyoxalase superfamily protein
MARSVQVVIDCKAPGVLSRFWAAALGYVLQPPPEGFGSWEEFLTSMGVPEALWDSRSAIVDPDGGGPRIFFQKVPEPKSLKNRLHLDIRTGGPDVEGEERRNGIDARVQELLAIGATLLRPVEEMGEYWVVLQDPEGNEFCVT